MPSLFEVIIDLEGSKLQLGEYLTITGIGLAFIIIILFAGPTLFSVIFAGKRVFQKQAKPVSS